MGAFQRRLPRQRLRQKQKQKLLLLPERVGARGGGVLLGSTMRKTRGVCGMCVCVYARARLIAVLLRLPRVVVGEDGHPQNV